MAHLAAAEKREQRLTDPDEFGAFYVDALPRVYGYFFVRC